jgi:hypothetical protein
MNLIARLASKTHATPHMTLINFVRILRGEAHATLHITVLTLFKYEGIR